MQPGLMEKKHSTPTITAGVGSCSLLVKLHPVVVLAPFIRESRYKVALTRLVVVAVVVKALCTAQTKVVIVVYLVTPIPPVIIGVSLCAVVRAVVTHIKYIYSFSTLVA
jgi:hypothetical protein